MEIGGRTGRYIIVNIISSNMLHAISHLLKYIKPEKIQRGVADFRCKNDLLHEKATGLSNMNSFVSQTVGYGMEKELVFILKAGDIDGFVSTQSKEVVGADPKYPGEFNENFGGREPITNLVERNDAVFYPDHGSQLFLCQIFLLPQSPKTFAKFHHMYTSFH